MEDLLLLEMESVLQELESIENRIGQLKDRLNLAKEDDEKEILKLQISNNDTRMWYLKFWYMPPVKRN